MIAKPGVQEKVLLHLLDYADFKEKVEVPGKERVITKEVKVPGPEKIVYKDKIVEKIVYKTDNSKKNSSSGGSAAAKEKVVYKEKPVEKIVYKDKIVEKKVQVPGPEKIVYKDKPVEKICLLYTSPSPRDA